MPKKKKVEQPMKQVNELTGTEKQETVTQLVVVE